MVQNCPVGLTHWASLNLLRESPCTRIKHLCASGTSAHSRGAVRSMALHPIPDLSSSSWSPLPCPPSTSAVKGSIRALPEPCAPQSTSLVPHFHFLPSFGLHSRVLNNLRAFIYLLLEPGVPCRQGTFPCLPLQQSPGFNLCRIQVPLGDEAALQQEACHSREKTLVKGAKPLWQ